MITPLNLLTPGRGSLHWVAANCLSSPPTPHLPERAPRRAGSCRSVRLQTTGAHLFGLADYMQLLKGGPGLCVGGLCTLLRCRSSPSLPL